MKHVTRVISFTSGKGGVGKTNTMVNLGLALSRLGRKVLLLDADLGLANIDIMLGLKPVHTIYHVLQGVVPLEEIMLDGPEGLSIIPAASGVELITTLSANEKILLMDAIENISYDFDYLLIDTQAGIGPDVMYFNSASSEVVCIITSEPTSLTDAYALIKVLVRNYGEKTISVIANNVPSESEAGTAFRKLERAVARFLHTKENEGSRKALVDLRYLGHVPSDRSVSEAVMRQRALLEVFPSSRAGLSLQGIARKIDAEFQDLRIKGGMQFFFKQLLEAGAYGS